MKDKAKIEIALKISVVILKKVKKRKMEKENLRKR